MITIKVFSAKWCKHCGGIDKALESIAIVEKIDIDEHDDLAEEYNIEALPTIVILQNHLEVKRFVGETLVSEVENYLKTLE